MRSRVINISSDNHNIDNRIDQSWLLAIVAFFSILLILIGGYWNSFASMVAIWWRSGTFTHCFSVIPISLYLIWRQRDLLLKLDIEKSNLMIFPLAILVLIWVLAYSADVVVIQQLSVIAMIPIISWQVFGKSIVIACLFPLLYLFFAVPIGEVLVAPLQDLTATFTVATLRFSGIPVFWEGRFFSIPSGRFEVAEACSGIRYLIASITLGTLYAYLTFSSYYRRLIFIVIATAVPVFANALRAYGIVMIAHFSEYKYAVGFDHLIYGWLFFGLVMFVLFWIGTIFSDKTPNIEKSSDYNNKVITSNGVRKNYFLSVIGLSAIVLVNGPMAAMWIDAPSDDALPLLNLDQIVPSPWRLNQSRVENEGAWRPMYIGASKEYFARYEKLDKAIQLYIANYSRQNAEGELINSLNTVYDRKKWKRVSDEIRHVTLLGKKKWAVHETVISSENKKKVIWSWFVIGGMTTTNSIVAKLYTARARLAREKYGSSIFAIAADYDINQTESDSVLIEFLDDSLPDLQKLVGSSI